MDENNDSIGFIKLHRSLMNDQYFWADKPFAKGQAWIDLLMLANWKRRKCLINGRLVWLYPGDIYASTRFLAERWGWSKNKVSTFLKDLVKGECIIWPQKGQQNCIISLENWERYQNSFDEKGPEKGQRRDKQRPEEGQRLTQSKERKNKRIKEYYNNHSEVGEKNEPSTDNEKTRRQSSHKARRTSRRIKSESDARSLESVFDSLRDNIQEDDG